MLTIVSQQHRIIDKQRITSDNYRVYLYLEQFNDNGTITHGSKPLLTLTNTSLTKFDIAADDEIKKKKPCTRKEYVSTVIHKGFDMNLQFAKVTDDISSMMFHQYIKYHGNGFGLGLDKKSTGNNKVGEGVSVFGNQEVNYEVPTYMLQIEIMHFNAIKEIFQFHNCRFFNFKQTVEESSSDIIESIQCFSSHPGYSNEGSKNVFEPATKVGIAGHLKSTAGKKYFINPVTIS